MQPPLQTLVLPLGSCSFLLVLRHGLLHHLQNLLHSFRQQLLHTGAQTLEFGHLHGLITGGGERETMCYASLISTWSDMLLNQCDELS